MTTLEDIVRAASSGNIRLPRHVQVAELPPHHAEGCTPFCGDRNDAGLTTCDAIVDVGLLGKDRFLTTASARSMAPQTKGKPAARRAAVHVTVERGGTGTKSAQCMGEVGTLVALSGVRRHPVGNKYRAPVRHNRRTVPFQALVPKPTADTSCR